MDGACGGFAQEVEVPKPREPRRSNPEAQERRMGRVRMEGRMIEDGGCFRALWLRYWR